MSVNGLNILLNFEIFSLQLCYSFFLRDDLKTKDFVRTNSKSLRTFFIDIRLRKRTQMDLMNIFTLLTINLLDFIGVSQVVFISKILVKTVFRDDLLTVVAPITFSPSKISETILMTYAIASGLTKIVFDLFLFFDTPITRILWIWFRNHAIRISERQMLALFGNDCITLFTKISMLFV